MLKKLLNKKKFKLNCLERINQSIRKIKYHASRYLTLFSCNKLMCSCKSEAHVANYCNYKLSRDIEKNPGPPICVDPNKTIAAPYSQGNELVFGQNAGQKCVAMSLCSLIYNHAQGISWSYANNEYWKSVLFKFVPISQTGIFNAVRITLTCR